MTIRVTVVLPGNELETKDVFINAFLYELCLIKLKTVQGIRDKVLDACLTFDPVMGSLDQHVTACLLKEVASKDLIEAYNSEARLSSI